MSLLCQETRNHLCGRTHVREARSTSVRSLETSRACVKPTSRDFAVDARPSAWPWRRATREATVFWKWRCPFRYLLRSVRVLGSDDCSHYLQVHRTTRRCNVCLLRDRLGHYRTTQSRPVDARKSLANSWLCHLSGWRAKTILFAGILGSRRDPGDCRVRHRIDAAERLTRHYVK